MNNTKDPKISKFLEIVDSEKYLDFIYLTDFNVVELPKLLSPKQMRGEVLKALNFDVYLIHEIIENAKDCQDLTFLKTDLDYYKSNHLKDYGGRNWLHVAAMYDGSIDIIKFLVNDLKIEIDQEDDFQCIPLHYACQYRSLSKEEFLMLSSKPNCDLLMAESEDGITPLELACGDVDNVYVILETTDVKKLLMNVDDVKKGLPQVDDLHLFYPDIPVTDFWLKYLHSEDKDRLKNFIKNDERFLKYYYLKSWEIHEIIMKCKENGLDILSNSKKEIREKNVTCVQLFRNLTGLKMKDFYQHGEVFYESALFLSLITGRLDFIPPLLMFCQFDSIVYGLLVCLICQRLIDMKRFPDQVCESISKVKDFCEQYSIAVLNKTMSRDMTEDQDVIYEFLNARDALTKKTALDLANLGKCSMFLSLPSCQDSLTKLWYKHDRKCPAAKFYLFSIFHCIFLILLAKILINDLYAGLSGLEIVCYIYGIGYVIEEIRLMSMYIYHGYWDYYFKNAKNYLNILASIILIATGILRCCFYPILDPPVKTNVSLVFEEDIVLFFCRLLLCSAFILFFMKIIYFGFIFEQLGSKMKMIGKMIVNDLGPVLFIFLIFIISFGVVFQSLLLPNSIVDNSDRKQFIVIISEVFKRSTFTIFNPLYSFKEMEVQNSTSPVNNEGKVAVYFILIIYIVVVNVMLMNLLIAIFSYTVTAMTTKSSESWKADRYKKIKEYQYRSLTPPPINVFEITLEIFCHFFKFINKYNSKEHRASRSYDIPKLSPDRTMPFKILQAFSLKNCRYQLIHTEEDKEYEQNMVLTNMKTKLNEIVESLDSITLTLRKRNIQI